MSLKDAIVKLGIPENAVLLKEETAPEPTQTLTQRVRPLRGGLAVARPGFNPCPFGLQVTIGSTRGFIATSHCSAKMFSKENTQWYQPSSTTSNSFAGTEFRDPPYVTSPADGRCPSNNACRSSDTAFSSYSSGVVGIENNGGIYRTTSIGSGSLQINSDPKPDDEYIKFFQMSGKQYDNPVGTTLHKVGRTTGWNSGRVVATDLDLEQLGTVDGRQRYIFSSTRVQAPADGGDSGSPVFSRRLVNGTYLHYFSGILWGSPDGTGSNDTYVFSDVSQIEKDMGTLTVR